MQLTISLPLDFITTKGLEEKPLSPKEVQQVLKDHQSCIPTADDFSFLTRENIAEDQEENRGTLEREEKKKARKKKKKGAHLPARKEEKEEKEE